MQGRVSAKPGLWTVDWTVDWTLDWTVDCPGTAEAKVLGHNQDTEQWIWLYSETYEYTHKHTHMKVRDKLKCIEQLG